MCGIAGAIGAIDPTIVGAVRRASDRQRARGPDSEGEWPAGGGAPGRGTFFSFRRLKIIDLSPLSDQPMVDAETGNVLVFNGEIYNFKELRRELEGLGHRFRSSGDGEVILKAYAQWGRDCVRRLRGMFAFALRDAADGRVLLARDRVGIKPLYWARVNAAGGGPSVLFASEVRSLLATGLVERRIDHTGLSSFLWNGFVVGPGTFVRGVSQLPPGTTALVDPQSPDVRPEVYWRIPCQGERVSDPGAVGEALRKAVSQHLLADVRLGVLLSGGIDSSAIAALAARSGGGRISTFNVSFDEAAYDEAPYAQRVAEQLGTEHHDVRLTQADFTGRLDAALDSLDQPTFDAINTYFVSRAVRDAGLTVALAGTGGDELFGGYRSFAELPRLKRVARACAHAPAALVSSAARAAARARTGRPGAVPPQTRWGKLPEALATGGDLLALYQVAYGLFTSDFVRELSTNGDHSLTQRGIPPDRAAELAALTAGRTDLSAISALELSCFLGERLLRDTDAASMAVSLEVRVPLLDHEFIEALAGLDDHTRFGPVGSKRLLRELALGDLDPAVFQRPKSGFVLPLEVWCRRGLSGVIADTFSDRGLCEAVGLNSDTLGRLWSAFQAGAPGMYWSRVWALFVVLDWSRRHGVTR